MVFPVENNLNRKYPIAVLDFNSLYPNIMSSYNLSPEKVILDESNDFDSEKYDAISHTVIIDDIEKTGILLRHK